MKYEKAQKVYVCCGQYIVLTKAIKNNVKCPRCNTTLKTPIDLPNMVIVKQS